MDPRVTEFQCIMPLKNIPSVLKHGILSNERADEVPHESLAMEEAQERRHPKQIPGGLKLHQYANLYFHARNPMMYKRKDRVDTCCVLRVSLDVLQLPGVVIADRNASKDWVRFLEPSQWRFLDFERIFADDWTDSNFFEYIDKKGKKCAEVLVPHRVEPRFLIGAYTPSDAVAAQLQELGFLLPITVNRGLFFR
jgi:ssDNA thymidine ADP-ribosyltransferase, DarT